MQRTQVYVDEALLAAVKQQANQLGVSVSAYIREVLKKDLAQQKSVNTDFDEFAGMWQDRDISQTLLRKQAWKKSS